MYIHNWLVAFDQFAAVFWFNVPDVTISSLCWLARSYPDSYVQNRVPLHRWQLWVLRALGGVLDFIQYRHCILARESDLQRGARIEKILA
jgi:hypothetical protein